MKKIDLIISLTKILDVSCVSFMKSIQEDTEIEKADLSPLDAVISSYLTSLHHMITFLKPSMGEETENRVDEFFNGIMECAKKSGKGFDIITGKEKH